MKSFIIGICAVVASLFSTDVFSQDFVYKPVNPMFGGDVFNYQQLLNSANAQNTIEEENDILDQFNRDPLKDFEESLNRQILNELSRSLVQSQFGEDGLASGSYVLGNYKIDVTEGNDGVEVNILDEGTGNQTTVIIPFL